MKKIRQLKVYERNYIPLILLQGKWLDKAGFNASDKLLVTLCGNTIIITKVIKE